MNKLGTVIGFTFRNKVRTKAFLITTLILAIIMSIAINIPYFIQLFTGEDLKSGSTKIGLVYGEQAKVAEQLDSYWKAQNNDEFTFVKYDTSDVASLKKDIEAGTIDGYLQFSEDQKTLFPSVVYSSDEDDGLNAVAQAELSGALQAVKMQVIVQDSLTPEQIAELKTPVQFNAQNINADASAPKANDKDKSTQMMEFGVVYLLIILFFFTSMTTGNMIASEVTTEKSSRIMEILITSVSPLTQMFGKIIGMFLVGLTQIAVFVLVILGNLFMPQNKEVLADFNIDLSQVSIDVLVYGFTFYVLGYFLYAVLFAAVGSIVSRTEDLGQAIMPITMLSLAAFYVGSFSMGAPNTMLMKVASFIPFLSPTTMIVRIGIGEIEVWEIWVSILLLVISILFFGWLSAKIYRTGVLMYGKRPTIKELRKAMKAYKI
ncbi:ABC transporter permease [Paenibacillus macquariensis]|uniref:ABC-2 type transport system permease protein n=1 Tax=Paenibacillus macquariensis TaxID=948756 RepID=A0ABY1K928_9BACL|nr:ABC transporter permease [Paenibacillus macquariensis]MEC0091513.1 ABC transporter permease [Paenibacillus macquariensis]OAB26645.1 ABC transporter permease [Paenibacillus macquariensis subsp. macquariensis]SIR43933.1 ABC-2 type transport system permease protein [Paenibacillus macquariensis]